MSTSGCNALAYLPRKADDDFLTELRWRYDRQKPAGSPARSGGLTPEVARQVPHALRLGR